jgi:ankyrin repeat protein
MRQAAYFPGADISLHKVALFLLLQYGRAPLHWASSRGNTDIMEMLIASKCDIEAKDKVGSES